jgi:hypothetical protein
VEKQENVPDEMDSGIAGDKLLQGFVDNPDWVWIWIQPAGTATFGMATFYGSDDCGHLVSLDQKNIPHKIISINKTNYFLYEKTQNWDILFHRG